MSKLDGVVEVELVLPLAAEDDAEEELLSSLQLAAVAAWL